MAIYIAIYVAIYAYTHIYMYICAWLTCGHDLYRQRSMVCTWHIIWHVVCHGLLHCILHDHWKDTLLSKLGSRRENACTHTHKCTHVCHSRESHMSMNLCRRLWGVTVHQTPWNVNIYIERDTHRYVCTYICGQICIDICMCIYVYMYVYMHVCVCMAVSSNPLPPSTEMIRMMDC